MNTTTSQRPVHTCGNCGRRTAVVDGWAHDYESDGFTPSDRIHHCGEGDYIGASR